MPRAGGIAVALALAGCIDVPPLYHDEDGDRIRDEDDLCPHLPETPADADTDTDQDGIGDACDLDFNAGGEHVYFLSFVDGIGDLQQVGEWRQLDDEIELGAIEPVGDAILTSPRVLSSVRIEVGFEIQATGMNDTELGVFTALPAPGDGELGDNGYLGRYNGIDAVNVWEDDAQRNFLPISNSFEGLVGRFVVEHDIDPAGDRMYATLTDVPSGPYNSIMMPAPTRGPGQTAILARDAKIRLRYLYIVGRP